MPIRCFPKPENCSSIQRTEQRQQAWSALMNDWTFFLHTHASAVSHATNRATAMAVYTVFCINFALDRHRVPEQKAGICLKPRNCSCYAIKGAVMTAVCAVFHNKFTVDTPGGTDRRLDIFSKPQNCTSVRNVPRDRDSPLHCLS